MLDEYRLYLREDRLLSENTIDSYISDIDLFLNYACLGWSEEDLKKVDENLIFKYVLYLKDERYSYASINRKISALRSFFQYTSYKKYIYKDPTFNINFNFKGNTNLNKEDNIKEIDAEKILKRPLLKADKFVAYRDNLILSFIYYFKMDIQDIIKIELDNIDLSLGFLEYKDSVYSLEENVLKILTEYTHLLRGKFPFSTVFFVNYKGDPISRQSVWKLVKYYGQACGLDLSPQKLKSLSLKG